MATRIEEIILELIPKLKDDPKWMPTSQVDSHYNCVAWVFGVKDKNIWPDCDDNSSAYFNTDGNICMWPPGLPGKATIDNFIEFFNCADTILIGLVVFCLLSDGIPFVTLPHTGHSYVPLFVVCNLIFFLLLSQQPEQKGPCFVPFSSTS